MGVYAQSALELASEVDIWSSYLEFVSEVDIWSSYLQSVLEFASEVDTWSSYLQSPSEVSIWSYPAGEGEEEEEGGPHLKSNIPTLKGGE